MLRSISPLVPLVSLSLGCKPPANPAVVTSTSSTPRAEQHQKAGASEDRATEADAGESAVLGRSDADDGTERARAELIARCHGEAGPPLSEACVNAFPVELACPASRSALRAGEYCGLQGRTRVPAACTYPEAICRCAREPYCGGATPSYLQQHGLTWSCRPPPAPDDCPEDPSPGARCTRAGQVCAYRACGSSTRCACTGGVYQCETQSMPLPPSAAPSR